MSLTYNMNILQHIPVDKFGDVLVTMNPDHRPRLDLLQGEYIYRHPLYTRGAIGAQQRWREVSGVNRTHYCGAYWFHGFHEDGLNSALRVARALGVAW